MIVVVYQEFTDDSEAVVFDGFANDEEAVIWAQDNLPQGTWYCQATTDYKEAEL